jgi:acetyl-CoA carboxylase biotin carboxylase subunit
MEMNTRLQVEHPVTECITGLDLVELQLRVAAREPLPLRQEDVVFRGHAIECRINAEDPSQGFRPSPGRVTRLDFPTGKGIRVDTHLRAGDRIPPYYDSMIAKLIVHGDDRADALDLLGRALQEVRIEGVKTNLDLQRRIVAWDVFRQGRYDTTSLESDLMGD